MNAGSDAAEESDGAEEFSLCEKPLAVAVRAQMDAEDFSLGEQRLAVAVRAQGGRERPGSGPPVASEVRSGSSVFRGCTRCPTAAEGAFWGCPSAAEESDAAEEFSLCEKPLAVAVRA